jgi:nucleoside-diphosphate-sugar epimerase
MRVLLIEVTSYLGAAIRDALVASDHHVVTCAHANAQAFVEAVVGVDAVIWTSMSNDPEVEAEAIHAVLEALHGTGKAFVFTSGAWVHGDTGGEIVDETGHLRPPPIVAWRADLEHEVLEAHGVRGIVIRPGVVYGHGGGLPAMLVAEARRRGVVRVPGTGENHWPVVHVDDLADLYARAVEFAPAGTVLLGVHRTERLLDVARAASEAGGADGETVPWPLDEARRTLGGVADALVLDQRLASHRAMRLLDWRPWHVDLLTDLHVGSYCRHRAR